MQGLGTQMIIAGTEGVSGRVDGPGKNAKFDMAKGMAISKDAKTLYVLSTPHTATPSHTSNIRAIDLTDSTYTVSTVFTSKPGTFFNSIAVDKKHIYLTDKQTESIVKLSTQ